MQVEYFERKTAEIPNDRLEELVGKIREKWNLDLNADIPTEDILIQAASMGLIELPDKWHASDEEVSAAELAYLINEGTKKSPGKRITRRRPK